jgi:hypothetical protein
VSLQCNRMPTQLCPYNFFGLFLQLGWWAPNYALGTQPSGPSWVLKAQSNTYPSCVSRFFKTPFLKQLGSHSIVSLPRGKNPLLFLKLFSQPNRHLIVFFPKEVFKKQSIDHLIVSLLRGKKKILYLFLL